MRVSTGLYRENITLASGVSVLGGHSHVNWVRNPAVFGTSIRGLDAGSGSDRVVVTAIGITAPTELSGFTITGINAGTGGNSIGVYVRDSDNDLLIQDNDIAAGAAGNGSTGAAGTPGSAGSNGSTARGGLGGEGGWHLEGYISGSGTNCQVYGNPIEGGVGLSLIHI